MCSESKVACKKKQRQRIECLVREAYQKGKLDKDSSFLGQSLLGKRAPEGGGTQVGPTVR